MKGLCLLIIISLLIIWLIYSSNNNNSFSSINKLKIAVVFYGLTRSLKYTIESIENNIFKELDKHNDIDYDVYLHTWYFDSLYHNPRAKEANIKLDFNEYKLLNPDVYQIDNQDEYDKQNSSVYQQVKEYGEHKDIPYISQINMFRAYESLQRATYLWENSGISYDIILVLRPDILYKSELKVKQFYELPTLPNKDNIIYIPRWSSCSGYNDRMAFGTPQSMKIYGHMVNYFISDYEKYGIYNRNPEYRIKQILNENGIYSRPFKMKKCNRIRANGKNMH